MVSIYLKLDLHTCSLFSIVLFGRSCSRSNNTPLRVASGVSMNTLSQIYICQSEIESTLQNNQSVNRFLRVFGVCVKEHGSLHAIWLTALRQIFYHYLASMSWNISIKQFWNVSTTKNIVWQYYQLVLESHCRLVNQQLTKTMNDKAIVCSPLHQVHDL
jgi:hypothetical protein